MLDAMPMPIEPCERIQQTGANVADWAVVASCVFGGGMHVAIQ